MAEMPRRKEGSVEYDGQILMPRRYDTVIRDLPDTAVIIANLYDTLTAEEEADLREAIAFLANLTDPELFTHIAELGFGGEIKLIGDIPPCIQRWINTASRVDVLHESFGGFDPEIQAARVAPKKGTREEGIDILYVLRHQNLFANLCQVPNTIPALRIRAIIGMWKMGIAVPTHEEDYTGIVQYYFVHNQQIARQMAVDFLVSQLITQYFNVLTSRAMTYLEIRESEMKGRDFIPFYPVSLKTKWR